MRIFAFPLWAAKRFRGARYLAPTTLRCNCVQSSPAILFTCQLCSDASCPYPCLGSRFRIRITLRSQEKPEAAAEPVQVHSCFGLAQRHRADARCFCSRRCYFEFNLTYSIFWFAAPYLAGAYARSSSKPTTTCVRSGALFVLYGQHCVCCTGNFFRS